MPIKLRLIIILIILLVLSACNNSPKSDNNNHAKKSSEDSMLIYTTVFPLADFTRKIGGDYVIVKSIIPPGTDAHTFEPTQKTMIDIAEANAFIYNGMGLEAFSKDITAALSKEDILLIEGSEGIHLSLDSDHGKMDEQRDVLHNHHVDPHIWLDPIHSITIAENIKKALITLQPENKKEFEKNFDMLKEKLQKLDQSFKEVVKTAKIKKIIVSHSAYGYWEHAYGIEQISVSGLSPSDEPSQKELIEIIQLAKSNHIKHILFEQNISSSISETIKNEIGAKVLYLHNLSVLTEEDVKKDEDYFSLMEKNINVLKVAMN